MDNELLDDAKPCEVGNAESRFVFHSFPRPLGGESEDDTLARGLKILALMKRIGLILAPEVVHWDMTVLTPDAPPVDLLQSRASFTELAFSELTRHSEVFVLSRLSSTFRG